MIWEGSRQSSSISKGKLPFSLKRVKQSVQLSRWGIVPAIGPSEGSSTKGGLIVGWKIRPNLIGHLIINPKSIVVPDWGMRQRAGMLVPLNPRAEIVLLTIIISLNNSHFIFIVLTFKGNSLIHTVSFDDLQETRNFNSDWWFPDSIKVPLHIVVLCDINLFLVIYELALKNWISFFLLSDGRWRFLIYLFLRAFVLLHMFNRVTYIYSFLFFCFFAEWKE